MFNLIIIIIVIMVIGCKHYPLVLKKLSKTFSYEWRGLFSFVNFPINYFFKYIEGNHAIHIMLV